MVHKLYIPVHQENIKTISRHGKEMYISRLNLTFGRQILGTLPSWQQLFYVGTSSKHQVAPLPHIAPASACSLLGAAAWHVPALTKSCATR